MKRLMALMIALAMTAGGCAMAEQAEQAQGDALGQIAQVACSIQPGDEGYLVYCFAQIFNGGDRVIALDDGTLELVSGEQLLADQSVEQIWPSFINPGEHGYVFDVVRIIGEDGQQTQVPQVTGLDYRLSYMSTETAYANIKLDVQAQIEQRREDGPMTVTCAVKNNTDTDAAEPTITYGLFTEGGTLVYAGGRKLDDITIPAGQTIGVSFEVEASFVTQWIAYGAKPTQVQVNAVFRNNED